MNVMNKCSYCILLFSLIAFPLLFCSGQISPESDSPERGEIRIMFYNAENFFDVKDDSLHNDNEFLPSSAKNWNYLLF